MKLDMELPPFRVTGPATTQIEAVGRVVRIDLVDGGCCGTAYDLSTGRRATATESSAVREPIWSSARRQWWC
jgi:hypothetical protein